jgi:hypothetical protein
MKKRNKRSRRRVRSLGVQRHVKAVTTRFTSSPALLLVVLGAGAALLWWRFSNASKRAVAGAIAGSNNYYLPERDEF